MKIKALLLILLFIPCATALEITDLEFFVLNRGEPIGAVTTIGQVSSVDIKFVIQGEDFTRLEANLSGLNKDKVYVEDYEYEEKFVNVEQCTLKDGAYTCYIRNLILWLSSPTVTIPITLFNSSDKISDDQTYRFDIDDTKPEITFIGTDNCVEGVCYIPSGVKTPIKMVFQDTKASFENQNVWFNIDGKKAWGHTCVGLTCYGTAKVDCLSGEAISLAIIPSATKDDAYNPLANYMDIDLICDSEKPIVLNESRVYSSGGDYLRIGDIMEITLVIDEDMGPVSAKANFSAFGGEVVSGTCKEDKSLWNCTFASTVFGTDPYTASAEILISDFAGNTISHSIEQEVLAIDDDAEPDFWASSYDYAPRKINKQMMPYVDKKVYVHSTLTPKSSNTKILKTSVSSCKGDGATYLSEVPSIFNSDSDNTNPVIELDFLKTKIPDDVEELNFNCTLNIQSMKKTTLGNFYIQNPEKEVINIYVSLLNKKSPDQLIQAEITRAEQEALEFEQSFGSIRDTIDYAYQSCSVLNMMNAASGAMGLTASGLAKVPVTRGAAKPLDTASEYVGYIPEQASNTKVDDICQFITCKADINNKVTDTIGKLPGIEEMTKVVGYESYADFVNPDDSLIMSLLTMCLPSFAYNVQKLQALNCDYTTCLKRDALAGGFPVSECASIKAYNQCKFITGEVFEIIPYTAIADEGFSLIKDTIDDPISLFGTALTALCKIKQLDLHSLCVGVSGVTKVVNYYNTFKSFGAKQKLYQKPIDTCDAAFEPVSVYNHKLYEPGGIVVSNNCAPYGCVKRTEKGDSYEMIYGKDGEQFMYRNGVLVDEKKLDANEKELVKKYKKELEDNFKKYKDDNQKTYGNSEIYTQFQNYVHLLQEHESATDNLDELNELYSRRGEFKILSDRVSELKEQGGSRTLEAEVEYYRDLMAAYHASDFANLDSPAGSVDPAIGESIKRIEALKQLEKVESDYDKLKESFENAEYTDKDGNTNKIFPDGLPTEEGLVEEKELKSMMKDARKGQNKYVKEMKKQAEKQLDEIEYDASWGAEGWTSWMTAVSTVRAFNSISNLVSDLGLEMMPAYKKSIHEAFNNAITDKEYRTSVICDDMFSSLDDAPEFYMVNTGEYSSMVGAHIQAEKSIASSPEADKIMYSYAISGVVIPKEIGLEFEVSLNPGNKIIFANTTTIEQESYTFLEDDMLMHDSEKDYEKVCLKFKNDDLKTYFDYVHADNTGLGFNLKKEICNSIVMIEE